MPRPLKDPKAKAVQATVRLSPDAWARIDELRSPGETRNAAIESLVWRDAQQALPGMETNVRSVEQKRGEVAQRLIDVLKAETDDAAADAVPLGCRHDKWVPIAGGLRRCRGCGMVRGTDGTWRPTT